MWARSSVQAYISYRANAQYYDPDVSNGGTILDSAGIKFPTQAE